jgi:hypothetical protein
MTSTSKLLLSPYTKAVLGVAAVLAAGAVQAEAPLKPAVLPAKVVACNSLKNAETYAQYTKIAPLFAKDMLDRANCFEAKERMEAVQTGVAKGFTSLKLLTGHVVWVPNAQVQAVATTTR